MTDTARLVFSILLVGAIQSSGIQTIGQDKQVVQILPLSEEIIFDGIPDEDVWSHLEPFPFVMYQPQHGIEGSEKTDVRICFDENYLYVGAHLYYEDVSMMETFGKKRDYAQMTCDLFGIHLDTYFDKHNALVFYTNPNGIRFDASVKGDMKVPERDMNLSWNAFWEVKTVIDDEGWHAEFKIPLSTLRFQSIDGKVTMGLTLERYIPSKNEAVTYPEISLDYLSGVWKPSLAREIVLENLKSKKPFYISPYLLAGIGRNYELNEDETAYSRSVSPKLEPGVDLKVGLTSNLTMDLTLNTDFAQVEADDQQINLTRYSLFFPEKRVFFQEKSDAFDFNMGGPSNLFYSRRIGLNDGEPVRIIGGARVAGRIGGWDIGALDMQTSKMNALPSENFGVVRFRRTVFNLNSYVGGMITSRIARDGSYNFATGADGNIRVIGDDYFSFHLAHTLENGLASPEKALDPSRMQFVWDRRSDKGLAYDFTFTLSGKDFNPGIGFMRRNDYIGGYVMGQYGWLPEESSVLLRHKIKTEWMNYHNTHSLDLETISIKTAWSFETRGGFYTELAHHYSREVLTDTLGFTDEASILPGSYSFNYLSTQTMLPPTSAVVGVIMTEMGAFWDGWKITSTLMPTWSVTSSFDLSGTYRIDWVSFPERDIAFINHIIGMKVLWTFTTKTSLSSFVQYNTAVDAVVANVRFRYNPREGVDFYLVYNEGLNSDPYSRIPQMPISDNRTVIAKFTYTFGR